MKQKRARRLANSFARCTGFKSSISIPISLSPNCLTLCLYSSNTIKYCNCSIHNTYCSLNLSLRIRHYSPRKKGNSGKRT